MGRRGFTLVESVISLAILGAILLSVNMFMKPVTDLWIIQAFRDGVQNETRLALMRLVRELSQVKDEQSIYIAESSRIRFTTIQDQSITYRLNGTDLLRNDRVIAANIDFFELTYWDAANASIASPDVNPQETDIYRVSFSIRANNNGRTAAFRSQVQPRNLYG